MEVPNLWNSINSLFLSENICISFSFSVDVFCWMWNSKLAVVLFVLFVVCLFCLLFCLLFVCFVCFPTFCSLDHSCPFHSWSSLFAICPVLSLGNSLTGSSLHRLILVSPVSFHATQRSLLTILSKTRLLCDSLIFLFTSSVIFLQRLYLFPCFLSFYVNSSVWKFTLYSLIFLAFGEICICVLQSYNCSWHDLAFDTILFGLPCGLDVKESISRRPGFNPWRREWLPTPVFLPGGFHG